MLDAYSISPDPEPRKIIRRDEVLRMTGLSKTRLYDLMDKDEFPHQIPIGARAVGWYESEVQEWIRQREELRNSSGPGKRANLQQSRSDKGQPEHAVANCDSQRNSATGANASRRPPPRVKVRPEKDEFNSCRELNRANTPTSLTQTDMTFHGHRVLRDKATGNLLIVVGHLSDDWRDAESGMY